MTNRVVICSAVRTPVGALGGGLASILPRQLAINVVKGAIAKAGIDPKLVEYTTLGWVMQDPRSPNVAKTACEFAGCPIEAPGTTVHENCASGGAAIHDIARRIKLGEIKVGIAGGVESMSNVPRYLYAGRMKGQQFGDMTLVDGLMGALTDTTVGKKGELMGLLTERLVKKYGLTRQEQDEIAFKSHSNAIKAQEGGFFDYVTAVEVPGRKKGEVKKIEHDEGPKKHEMSWFTNQKPYFNPVDGTITSGNSSSLNDGGAAVLMTTLDNAKELGLPVMGELVTYGNLGVPKELMGEGAFKIVPKLFQQSSLDVGAVDFFEMNEAFAAVVGGALKDIKGLDADKVNQWGSGISIGHPVGCTGVRQVVDMLHQLAKRDKEVGLTSRCVGGGIGSGEILKRV